MDILSTIGDILPETALGLFSVGGVSLSAVYSAYKLVDKGIDQYFKKTNPDKFFKRLTGKSYWFARWMVKSVRFFDDMIIDPIKSKFPKTGENLENMVNARIDQIEAIFDQAFEDMRLTVKDKYKKKHKKK